MAIGDKKPVIMEADIGVEGGVPPYLHASQHSASGADPITLDMIGAASADLSNVSNEDMLTKIESSGFVGGSNPNLLDNWYFADPIDQRGGWVVPPGKTYYITGSEVGGTTDEYYAATLVVESADYSYWAITVDGATRYVTYADAIRGYTGAGYGIDRWMSSSAATLLRQDNYITLMRTGTDRAAMLSYYFEHYSWMYDADLVYSVLTTDGLYTKTGRLEVSSGAFQTPTGTLGNGWYFNVTGTASKSNLYFRLWNSSTDTPLEVIAVKLELGSVQTLAHQDEDGNWVLNDPPPNKALELAKCQRYQLMPNSNQPEVLAGNVNSAGAAATCFLPLPVTMRAKPTFIYKTA